MRVPSTWLVLGLLLSLGTGAHAQLASQSGCGELDGRPVPASYRELTMAFDAAVTPELIALLRSESQEAHWTCWAGLLGALGDDRAVDALISFVERPGPERLSLEATRGRSEAVRALGFLINRSGNERALRYLIDGLTPQAWRARDVRGISPWAVSYDDYDRELSTFALFGLAVSGNFQAGEALRTLQSSPTAAQMRLRSGLDSTLKQWLEVHGLVAERGLAGMYEYYDAQRRLEGQPELEKPQPGRASGNR